MIKKNILFLVLLMNFNLCSLIGSGAFNDGVAYSINDRDFTAIMATLFGRKLERTEFWGLSKKDIAGLLIDGFKYPATYSFRQFFMKLHKKYLLDKIEEDYDALLLLLRYVKGGSKKNIERLKSYLMDTQTFFTFDSIRDRKKDFLKIFLAEAARFGSIKAAHFAHDWVGFSENDLRDHRGRTMVSGREYIILIQDYLRFFLYVLYGIRFEGLGWIKRNILWMTFIAALNGAGLFAGFALESFFGARREDFDVRNFRSSVDQTCRVATSVCFLIMRLKDFSNFCRDVWIEGVIAYSDVFRKLLEGYFGAKVNENPRRVIEYREKIKNFIDLIHKHVTARRQLVF